MRLRADQQLFLSYLLLIAGLVVSLSLGADYFLGRHLMRLVEADLRREVALGVALYDETPRAAPDSLAHVLSALSGRRVTIITPEGTVIGESVSTPGGLGAMENHAARPEVRAALQGQSGVAVRYSATVGKEHMYLAAGSRRGDVIRFSVPLEEVHTALRRVQRSIYGVGAVALVLAAAFSFGFSLAVTHPLRRIRDVARELAAGNLSRRLRERRRDELGDLARALDALADELQRRLGQLEEERAEMQALIDSMSEGVLALTPGGALRRANPAARRMFALPEAVEGIPPEAVARRPEFLRLVERSLRGETVPPVELSSDGRSMIGTAHPLPDGGVVLVFLDVSELRRLEGVRRDFVANASHELKTPLTAIRGYSETLLDPDLAPDLRHRFAEVVKNNADRLQRIVDDLLDLSRIEAGGFRVDPEPVSLTAVAGEAWAGHAAGAAAKGVEFGMRAEPGAEQVFGDAGALHQVFANLFSNSLRYTPSGGRIEVHARPVRAPRGAGRTARGAGAPRGWVEVAVRDSGTGIPAAHLPRIFERFYRADPARSRAEGGTGLGLAIVRHLVEAHGGSIEAESRVGQGTTIRFWVPAAARSAEAPSP